MQSYLSSRAHAGGGSGDGGWRQRQRRQHGERAGQRHIAVAAQQARHLERQLDRLLDLLAAERRGAAQHQGLLSRPADAGQAEAAALLLPHTQAQRRGGGHRIPLHSYDNLVKKMSAHCCETSVFFIVALAERLDLTARARVGRAQSCACLRAFCLLFDCRHTAPRAVLYIMFSGRIVCIYIGIYGLLVRACAAGGCSGLLL